MFLAISRSVYSENARFEFQAKHIRPAIYGVTSNEIAYNSPRLLANVNQAPPLGIYSFMQPLAAKCPIESNTLLEGKSEKCIQQSIYQRFSMCYSCVFIHSCLCFYGYFNHLLTVCSKSITVIIYCKDIVIQYCCRSGKINKKHRQFYNDSFCYNIFLQRTTQWVAFYYLQILYQKHNIFLTYYCWRNRLIVCLILGC